MGLAVSITNGRGVKSAALVTNVGQLVTAAFDYDETEFRELGLVNTPFNFYGPKANHRFVITGIVAVADKEVASNASATVVVYEAAADDTLTILKVLFQTAMIQDQINILLPLNILVNEGVWVNAKTTDDDIHMTIMGYRIPIR